MYESSTKETKWVCIQVAFSRRPRAFEEAHCWNIQPSSIMKNSHQYMKVTIQETLYHDDHGATLKHKCGKRIVTLPLLSFLSFFICAFSPFLWPLFFSSESHPDLWGNHSLHHPFLTRDNALIMMIITLLLITTHELQLETRTRYDSI